jgi:hypothetical protein
MARAKMVERPNNSLQTQDGPFVTNTEMIKVDDQFLKKKLMDQHRQK